MKTLLILPALALQLHVAYAFSAADSTGLPGDHFDLYAMLDVFKASSSPEDFEKRLNTENNHVNNLDLNGDRKVDFIRVVDYSEKGSHALVLRVAVNEKESQDIAVIEIEQKGESSAQLQVIGDELLYGKDYIIEPRTDSTVESDKKLRGFNEQTFVFVNVWYWPCISYMYYPGYVIWVSPWYWGYWPGWWYPWPPVIWIVYYDWVYIHHSHYHQCYHHSTTHAHSVYQPRRVVSTEVTNSTTEARKNYEQRKNTPPKPSGPRPSQEGPTPTPQPPTQSKDQPRPVPQPSPSPAPRPTPAPHPQPQPQPHPQPQPKPVPTPRPK